MPLRTEPYAFPDLPPQAFKGLPGMLADSLPDKFGNDLIDTWLAQQGRESESISAIERLSYIGTRGTGALEFAPAKGPKMSPNEEIQIGELVELAARILAERDDFVTTMATGGGSRAARDPQRRHVSRRRPRQGGDRLEPRNERGALRAGRRAAADSSTGC